MSFSAKPLVQRSLIVLLIMGGALVLYPFLAAILFSIVLCVTSWPAYARLRRVTANRDTPAALSMTALLILVLLAPTVLLAIGLSDAAHSLREPVAAWFSPQTTESFRADLARIPYVGETLSAYWSKIAGDEEFLQKTLQSLWEPARRLAFASIALVGNGVLQLALVIFISFFLYRDGTTLAAMLINAARRLGGALGVELVHLSRNTVMGVMIGIVGTALAQAVVAFFGFLLAGVPGAILLSMATFFLSMIPIGPPLVWGGAALWLYQQNEVGWAIFMVLYGLLVISSVDNFVKPILISRAASLPILLIALGVFGGILAFGFIGIFLGPTLLALAHMLCMRWLQTEAETAVMPERD
ncbi:MAG: AI-2E family transporter [Zoogloeaceae bacterium]|nr:AI-2E family transporter [Zoogloeaceae bacterium]